MFFARNVRLVVALGLVAMSVAVLSRLTAHNCPGPFGYDDPNCKCPVVPTNIPPGTQVPDCVYSSVLGVDSSEHGCCNISGCTEPKRCKWKITAYVVAQPGAQCDVELRRANVLVTSGSTDSDGLWSYTSSEDDAVLCANYTTYDLYVAGTKIQSLQLLCQLCPG
jgi:hypothetical protein